MESIMKRFGHLICITLLVAIFVLALASCGSTGTTPTTNKSSSSGEKQVPIYQGMTISSRINVSSGPQNAPNDNARDNGKYKIDNPMDGYDGGHWIFEFGEFVWVDKHGNKYWRWVDGRLHHVHHPGCQHGDYNGRNDEVDVEEIIEENIDIIEETVESTLEVIGAAESIYYAETDQDIYITIHISNPSAYEILSFVLNGSKYTSYMFENGSDLENLILKKNVGSTPGIHEYTIDEIKYVDGTEIKDVLMNGDKTVKSGVYTYNMVSAALTNEDTTLTSLSYNVILRDNYNLIEKSGGFIKSYLYDGNNIVEKELTLGENTIIYDELTQNTLYSYAVVAFYDDLTGNGADVHIVASGAMYTDTIVLFKDIEVTQTSISWDYDWESTFSNKAINSLSLYKGDEKISDLESNAKTADGLLSNNQYKIVAKYNNVKGQEENISISVTTLAKAVPSVVLSDIVETSSQISCVLTYVDTDDVGEITEVALILNDNVVQTTEERENIVFSATQSGTQEYSIVVKYKYDLNDGLGVQNSIYDAIPTHDYEDVVTAPTCTEQGYTTHTCKKCGFIMIDTYVSATGHKYEETYLFDDVQHWHPVICEHTGVEIKEEHTFVGGICSICGYDESARLALEYSKIEGKEEYMVDGITNDNITMLYIPDTYNGFPVTEIGDYAFVTNTNLRKVIISDVIVNIGIGAFQNCSNLTEVYLGNNLMSIRERAFSSCDSLTKAILGNSVTSIEDYAFYDCSSLTNITIPNCVERIGEWVFHKSGLINITIPDSVISLGNDVFFDCDSLTTVVIGNNVTNIGEGTFHGCDSLTNVTIGDSVMSIGIGAFGSCSSLSELLIPDSVTSIGNYAFQYCNSLTTVTIGNNVASIGEYAFMDCSNLMRVTMGNSVKSIGCFAFAGCSSLTSVTISNSLTVIRDAAFISCQRLKSITIPSGVTNIGESAFSYCTSLKDISFNGTKAEWNAISKGAAWNNYTSSYVIHCTDGDIAK